MMSVNFLLCLKVCAIIFGDSSDDYPHPAVDAKGFVRVVTAKNKAEPKVMDMHAV